MEYSKAKQVQKAVRVASLGLDLSLSGAAVLKYSSCLTASRLAENKNAFGREKGKDFLYQNIKPHWRIDGDSIDYFP